MLTLFNANLIASFIGGAAGVLAVVGIFAVWDYFLQRKEKRGRPQRPLTAEQVLERQLEQYLVEHFSKIFKGWRIYGNEETQPTSQGSSQRPLGVRYRTKAGEIDLLCVDSKNNLVVVELKRDRAPDRVVAQVDRYIAWVKKHLAKPDQRVYGIIIARRFDQRLFHTLQRRRDIKIWTFSWHLRLNKRPSPDE